MFSITLKRSAATLGVVAGLLAAAAPANAMGTSGQQGNDALTVKAPRDNSSEVLMESLTLARVNLVEELGSDEYVKAPTNAEQQRVVELPEEADAQFQRRVPDRAIGTVEELLELKAPASAGTQIGIEDLRAVLGDS
jgi:hypothetical protein